MKRETEEWLKIAREEYKSAMVLFEKRLYRMVCYHAQQTVEKILKAILTERDVDFARTHNILDLRNAAIQYEIEDRGKKLLKLLIPFYYSECACF